MRRGWNHLLMAINCHLWHEINSRVFHKKKASIAMILWKAFLTFNLWCNMWSCKMLGSYKIIQTYSRTCPLPLLHFHHHPMSPLPLLVTTLYAPLCTLILNKFWWKFPTSSTIAPKIIYNRNTLEILTGSNIRWSHIWLPFLLEKHYCNYTITSYLEVGGVQLC